MDQRPEYPPIHTMPLSNSTYITRWRVNDTFSAHDNAWRSRSRLEFPTRTRRLRIASKIHDWIWIIICLILTQVLYAYIHAPDLYFRIDDPTLRAPVLPDLVSSFVSTVVSVAIPLVGIVLMNFAFFTSWTDIYHSVTGLVQALATTMVICSFFWATIGGVRPYHLTKCNPDPAKLVVGQFYYTPDVCRGTIDKIDLHGFPSGHAGSAFACWVFFSYWIFAKLKLWNGTAQFYKMILTFLPLIVPAYISLTRVIDFHHFPHQVIVGALIGIFSATFAYKLNYPMHGWFYGENDGNGDVSVVVVVCRGRVVF
ncbi:PAP2 superfamily-domain-containing protein [Powellomyces hirtus]|nr:PAP2 superfamily-domain-containing protein [Powellomyces hirtus]